MSDSLWPHESQHARTPCPSPTPGVPSNSGPLSQWCHPVISSTVVPFSSFPQSLPASESFPMSQLFTWGGQSIGVSASASVLLYLASNIILFFPRTVTIPCHSANNETESVQVSGSLLEKKCSLSALLIKPLKDSFHPYQRGEGIMMIICSIVQGKGEKRWNVVSAKSDKHGWLISIQKSPFLSIQLMPIKHLWCARLRDGNFCFYRGRRLGFLDSSAEITIQLT